jgi:polysaccharide export outer membrane protein
MEANPHRLASPRNLIPLLKRMLPAMACMAFMALGLGITACAHRSTPPPFVSSKIPATGIVSAGDTLRLTFRKLPELNQVVRVRPDGRINLLQVGTVKASGKSVDTLQAELASRYELKSAGDLIVSVDATYLAVYVTGAVGKPGKVVLDRPMTLLEAIMESGGFDRETANLKKVSLTRKVNGRFETRWIDLRDPAAGGEYVQPFDMIEVNRFFR